LDGETPNENIMDQGDIRPIKSTLINRTERSYAIVTPTYLPDLKRCELLAESLDRVAPHAAQYLIVDRRDRSAFAHLERGRRRIIDSEAIIGNWMWRLPARKSYWLSLRALPVRGWIIQQILKIGVADLIAERTMVFCDSDTAFLRYFNGRNLLVDGKIGLLDVDFHTEATRRWTYAARRLLGISQRDGGYRNFVGNMICWNRETVKAMQERIELITGMKWQVAIARTSSFSEYMLYGIFVREFLGYAEVDHAPSAVPLVKASWGSDLTTDSSLDAFFGEFDSRTVAVMVHSKDGVDPARFRHHLERRWRQSDHSTQE
jgi:hypothetical protein